MGSSSPKTPDPPKPPPPIPAPAKLVDLQQEGGGSSNFEAELRRLRKKQQASKAGDTGGYGSSTKLG